MGVLEVLGAIGGAGGLGWVGEKAWRIGMWAYRAPSLSVWYSPSETGEVVHTPVGGEAINAPETRPMRWYHLQVRNTGRGTALGCTGTVENLEINRNGGWERHPNFVARIPLVWAHSGGKQERDIEPEDDPPWDRLDLLTVEPGHSLFQLVTPASGKGVQTGFRVNKSYRFTISVEDREGRTSAETHVRVDPAYDADGELEETPIEVTGHPNY